MEKIARGWKRQKNNERREARKIDKVRAERGRERKRQDEKREESSGNAKSRIKFSSETNTDV